MDFNDQRRMFMNMGGHPLVGNHSGLENPQVGQQESQQTPHSRLLLPTSSLSHTPLETTMTTMSMASLSSHMALTNPHLPMHLNLPHSSHIQQEQLTQAPPHPQHPTPHAPLQVPVIPPQVEETDETNNIVKNIKAQVPDSEPENEPELEEANEDESENEERWCLICNSNLPSFSQQQSEEDIIYLFHASMTISKRKLSGMLSRLVDLSENRTHSNVLCRRCFSLIEQIDGLEIELAGSKMELVQQYESTLTARHLATSDSKPIMDIEADWEESEEDAPEDTELSGKKRNRKAKRKGFPRKISNLADSKVTLEMDDDMMGMEEDGSEELKPFNVRRNRGRPKKIKEEEDSTNTQANPKECPNCGKTLPPQKYLKHLSSSHKMHPCPFCDTVLKRKETSPPNTPEPEENETFTEATKTCPYCPFVAANKKGLQTHVTENHPGQGMYACPFCTFSSSEKNNLTKHIGRRHIQEKPLMCPHCPYTCVEQRSLTTHIMKHTGERPFVCQICDYATTRECHLKLHIMKYHSLERPFKCKHCPYTTTRKVCLVSHMATHTGEKRYFCPFPQCNFGTPWNNSVASHIRSKHTGEKPFQCPHCSHRASERNNMKRHIQAKHTDIKPYACNLCSYTAALKVSIKNHMETMHKDSLVR